MKVEQQTEQRVTEISIPEVVPVIPSTDIIYPSMIVPMATAEKKTVRLVDEAATGDKIIGIFAQRPGTEQPPPANLYRVGTAATILRMLKMPDGSVRAFIQGICRIGLIDFVQTEPYLKARVGRIVERVEKTPELEALRQNILAAFQKIVSSSPNLPNELAIAAMNLPEPGNLADFVAAHINLSLQEQQEILETEDVKKRLEKLTAFVNRELEILELRGKIQSQAQSVMEKAQREFYLREQLKAIQKELGETDERTMEVNELRKKVEAANLPPEVRKEADRELDRLSKMPPQAAEYTTSRTYLDWLVSLPWSKSTEDNLDVERARQVLDEDHYNLEKVKERILDYLAVRKLKEDMKGPILCFVGPPGTGKTSMGRSIARALGRNFVRVSLGGIRDEAEIRGHRRTYVGALPGRIIQGIRRAGSNNPVFMLDEIDKIGADFRGDPSAALLEVLDPEQNYAFSDHYLEVPFDLSKVMFITTANLTDPIPPALRDRMEILELPGYTEIEKLHIARKFLIPKQLKEHGLTSEVLHISDDAVLSIVRNYTREAGLRNLEREISTICRKTARQVAQGSKQVFDVTADRLKEFLGPQKFRYELAEGVEEVGVATGLAWTQAGGDVLFVEATLVPGKGNLILTGQLGEVMQESARAAVTYARSRAGMLGADEKFYAKNDVHIHVPAGAIPKDGPSAGVTMALALISALTGKPLPKAVGMTGEITLRGKILPVGGIKEKVLAAHRAGVKKVILPADNEKDLEEVPEHVRNELNFVFVRNVDEVLNEVWSSPPLPLAVSKT
ncbi:MAG: endopeptidase La [Dehalococcoidia bacterium]|nr:endopeptidase La [Dehalococcoidia bacterium]